MKFFSPSFVLSAAVLAFASVTSVHAAVDAGAAEALFKKNGCNKCHDVSKTKKGPSLASVAAKFKGKAAEGQADIIKNITTGPKIKFKDGSEDTHKVIETKDQAELKNLADWILAQ